MLVRDRIKGLRRVRAELLRPNPRNWRTHGEHQCNVLRGVLAEIGYANALLARELADGTLELIDGHLRAETTPDAEVPVLVLDVSESEAAALLAMLDPLASLAGTNRDVLAGLIEQIETESRPVRQFVDELLADVPKPPDLGRGQSCKADIKIPELFQVVVECADETQQRTLFERLQAEGYTCRLLML
ncbi:MAG: ParB N-terminal domain-containing protein [Pirellulales bacterium]|nr:ParB N-terminal domain-containing protein [Pirellulales bacterium]